MTIEIAAVFAVIIIALYLFITEKLPVDITAFLIMVTLMILGLIFGSESFPTVKEGISGIANPATITVLAMFILSAGVQKTGIIHELGRKVFAFAGNSELRQILAIALLVGPISGIINNTAAVAIMLPMVLALAKRSGTPATKLLIPLSFFGMLGGTLTLIGTSTNILASDILRETEGFERSVGMFEFTKLGAIVFCIGFVYFLTIGRFLLPNRKSESAEDADDLFLTEIVLEKGHKALGKTIADSKLEEQLEIQVVKLIRGESSFIKEAKEKELQEDDILVVQASEQRIVDFMKKEGVKLLPNFDEEARKRPKDKGSIAKVMLKSSGKFQDKSLDDINIWKRFGVAVVGIHRNELNSKRLGAMKLKVGEVLLVQASLASLKKIKQSKDFLLLEEVEEEFDREKTWKALSIVAAVVLSATLGIPIVVAALVGVLAMFLTKCLENDEIYEAVNWEVIFLLAGVIPLGIAMEKSGTASLLAGGITGIAEGIPPLVLLMVLYLITTILTEIISNNAAVILLIPIAISIATDLGYSPFPFALAVMFAASTSFLSPVGYQTNTMVYGSANYRFSDFLKVGGLLNLILLVTTSFLIAFFWEVI